MDEIRLTKKFQDFLTELAAALRLPTENSLEHKCIEEIILYFTNLKSKPAHRDRTFKKEVQDLWLALGSCARHAGYEKTSQVFWNLQATLKQLKFERGFYEVLPEEFLQEEARLFQPLPRLKSFHQQHSSF